MRGRVSAVIVSFFWVLLHLTNVGVLAKVEKNPSIMVLLASTGATPVWESVKMVNVANDLFEGSKEFETIPVGINVMFWPTVYNATEYGINRNADYMVFMDISKIGGTYSYDAKLIKPMTGSTIAEYAEKWADEPVATKEAMGELVAKEVYTSLSKIRVNMIIESSPALCDIFRGSYRLGCTDSDGSFSKTVYWKKGSYKIKICKPGYRDWSDRIKVEKNPTDYSKKAILKKK